jgi:lactate racemase
MRVRLEYGTSGLVVEIPSANVSVFSPRHVPGLADEARAFREAVTAPIESRPLREIVAASDRVAVVIPDITRPLPSQRLLPWLFEALDHVRMEQLTIVNGTGSHRVNTKEELASMVGREVLERFRVVNHDSHDPKTMALAGRSPDGQPVYMSRAYVEADRRIVLGFIEPHFMAGFSGGYKGIFPAVADIASIMRYHDAKTIGDPRSTWGVLDSNPTQELIRHNGALLPVDFCVNVTLNRERRITRFFCGEVSAAHREGAAFSKATAMVACQDRFPIVVTSNSGYPLDQNLYQAVKGMSAAAQIVAKDGLILTAARCNDGFPEHGNFKKLLFQHDSPKALLETILAPGFSMYDQWEAQILGMIQSTARVGLYSELPAGEVERAHIEPVAEIGARIERELESRGKDLTVAVLPEGPMTIPYVQAA